jgi:hypothetical protein
MEVKLDRGGIPAPIAEPFWRAFLEADQRRRKRLPDSFFPGRSGGYPQ